MPLFNTLEMKSSYNDIYKENFKEMPGLCKKNEQEQNLLHSEEGNPFEKDNNCVSLTRNSEEELHKSPGIFHQR